MLGIWKSYRGKKLKRGFWRISDELEGGWILCPRDQSPEDFLLRPPESAGVSPSHGRVHFPRRRPPQSPFCLCLVCCPWNRSKNAADMGFCSCSVKYLLFIFNVFVVLCGLAVVVAGVMVSTYGSSLKTVVSEHVTSVSITLIVIGAIVFIIAFFGCCGAIRESSCMVTTYAVFLLTILIIEFAVGGLLFVYRAKSEEEFKQALQHKFESYKVDSKETQTVDLIQEEFKCCGIDGPSSWPHHVPKSCCSEKDDATDPQDCHPYIDGCIDKVSSKIKDWLQQLGGVAIAVACVEIFGVIFACFLSNSIKNKERRGYV